MASFFSTEGDDPTLPTPRGFGEVASVHSEVVTRRQGGMSCLDSVRSLDIPSQEPKNATSQSEGGFHSCEEMSLRTCLGYLVWKRGKITCLTIWIGHRNPILCIYWGILWVIILRRNRKLWFQTQYSARKWKFHCSFLTRKVISLFIYKARGHWLWSILHLETLAPIQRSLMLSSLLVLFLFKDIALRESLGEGLKYSSFCSRR